MVDGEVWDLDRSLEKSCELELIDYEHRELSVSAQSGTDVLTDPRKEGLLALQCTRTRASSIEAIRMLPLQRSSKRGSTWLLL